MSLEQPVILKFQGSRLLLDPEYDSSREAAPELSLEPTAASLGNGAEPYATGLAPIRFRQGGPFSSV